MSLHTNKLTREFNDDTLCYTRHSLTPGAFGRPVSLRFYWFFRPCEIASFLWFSPRVFKYIIAGYYICAVFTTHHTRSKNTVFGGPGPLPHYDQMSESFDRLHIEKPECRN